ncbi:MAG: DciA family protein [Pseudomonadota bacterium]
MGKTGGRRGKRRADASRIGHARSVAELLPHVGRKAFRKFGFVESNVVARWPEIVGTDIARRSTPDSIRFPQGKRSGGTLNLSVHGAHALAIQHEEPVILERVNRYFGYGAVARLAIRQGAAAVRERKSTRRPEAELDAGAKADLKVVEDDELRGALETLAAQIGVTSGPPKIG